MGPDPSTVLDKYSIFKITINLVIVKTVNGVQREVNGLGIIGLQAPQPHQERRSLGGLR
jgi:hypothetical protein